MTPWYGYENQSETMRVTFETMKNDFDKLAKLLSLAALKDKLSPEGEAKELKDWFDFSLLPSFDKIAKYFHFVALAALQGFTVMISSVTSVATAGFAPGEVVAVKLAAKPTPRVKTYSVQDRVPAGWTVIQVSDGGVFDPASGQVSWGPFADNQARELQYQVRSDADSPDRVQFDGEGNFDALTYPIAGTRQLQASSRLLVTQRSPNGEVQLRLNGRPGASYTVSASSDFIRWTPLGVMTELDGSWQFTDKSAVSETVRFYRATTP